MPLPHPVPTWLDPLPRAPVSSPAVTALGPLYGSSLSAILPAEGGVLNPGAEFCMLLVSRTSSLGLAHTNNSVTRRLSDHTATAVCPLEIFSFLMRTSSLAKMRNLCNCPKYKVILKLHTVATKQCHVKLQPDTVALRRCSRRAALSCYERGIRKRQVSELGQHHAKSCSFG